MKRILLILIVAVIGAAAATAREFTYTYEGQSLTYTVLDEDAKTCSVGSNTSVTGDLIIPEKASDGSTEYSVTTIGNPAFYNCSGLTSITIGNSVTTIGGYAFYNCIGLTSVTIPNSVITIDYSAFYKCSGLTSVTIGESVTSIGNNAFNGCNDVKSLTILTDKLESWSGLPKSNLKEVVIGDKVTTIPASAFYGCSGLTEVSIPNSVTTIGSLAFRDCTGLTSVMIPNSVTSIDNYAFYGCSGLTEVTIPESVTSIGNYAFNNCSGLIVVTIPNSVTTIGQSAFNNCRGLSMVDFASIESICKINFETWDANPLYYAEHLYISGEEVTNLVIPESVTSIGNYAFNNCRSLTSVTIPNSVTTIGVEALRDCRGLTSITIGNSVTTIGSYAFYNCSGLTSVTIPNSVTTIDYSAFYNCSGLTSLTIGSSVTSIGNYAFDGCSEVTSLTIMTDKLESWSFISKSNLQEVVIGDKVTTIPSSAFSGCSGLTSVTIGNSVTTIGDKAFYSCSGLTSVIIPESVTSIGEYTFYGCSGLTSVIIPNSVTTIGNYAFRYCSGLTSVMIPNSVTTIGQYAFYNCNGLKKAAKPNDLNYSFDSGVVINYDRNNAYADADGFVWTNDNTGLLFVPITISGSYSIPESVTSIGNNAFAHCSRLSSVSIPASVTQLGWNAFYNCAGISSITIPESITYIGNDAFSGCTGLKSVTSARITPININESVFSSSTYTSAMLNIPSESLKDYLLTNWGLFSNISAGGETVETLTDGTYYYRVLGDESAAEVVLIQGNYSYLTEATIPERFTDNRNPDKPVRYVITTIGANAFKNCTRLRSLSFANSSKVTAISAGAFSGCTGLESVSIPASVADINYTSFSNCTPATLSIYTDKLWSWSSLPRSKATKVVIGDKVTAIPGSAFYGCTDLTSVTIGNAVETINSYAFSECSSLTSVAMGNSVRTIGNSAFEGCTVLPAITIPKSVTSIGENAFRFCNALNSVAALGMKPSGLAANSFPNDVYANTPLEIPANTLGDYASTNWGLFYNITAGDIRTKTFDDGVFNYRLLCDPDSPEAILIQGDYSEMEEASIPARITDTSEDEPVRYEVTSLGVNAFKECYNLKAVYFNARSQMQNIGTSAFDGCTDLAEISLPETVKSLGDYVFRDCGALTGITIPQAVSAIGAYAFRNCSGLSEITIPESVTSIGCYAFAGCSGLTKADFANVESLCRISFGTAGAYDYTSNPASVAQKLYLGGVEVSDVVIPESVEAIGDFAFAGCTNLTSVAIPESIKSIGLYSFTRCTGLTQVTIPNSVTSLSRGTFSGCSNLSAATIGNSLATIPSYSFEYCPALRSLNVAESVDTIEYNAFYNSPAIADLTFRESYTPIQIMSGNNFDNVTKLSMGREVYASNGSQMKFSAVEDLTVGAPVSEISNGIFASVGLIKKLTVSDAASTLEVDANNDFSGVEELYMGRIIETPTGESMNFPVVEKVEIGNLMTSVPESAFTDCSSLKEVALGNSLQTIGSSAFSGCSLTEVVVPPSVETIEESAFAGNTDLATIIMGHNVKTIGEKAYDGCAAQTIRITALTPPTAPNNTFSRYTGQLWVANAQAVEAYYDAYTCWDRFSAYSMIEPEAITIEGEKTIDAAPGTVIRLTATITPENVTLPQIFWRSTDPAIATVDNDGVVTVHGEQPEYAAYATYAYGDEQTPGQCRIIAESLYADGPLAEVVINSDFSAIDNITSDRSAEKTTVDYSQPYDVYNMQGMMVGHALDNLLPGFYIIRQGAATAKIAIR